MGRHKEDKNSGNCVQDQKFGRHEIAQEDKYEWLPLIFFHAYQIEFQQIYQIDCTSNFISCKFQLIMSVVFSISFIKICME